MSHSNYKDQINILSWIKKKILCNIFHQVFKCTLLANKVHSAWNTDALKPMKQRMTVQSLYHKAWSKPKSTVRKCKQCRSLHVNYIFTLSIKRPLEQMGREIGTDFITMETKTQTPGCKQGIVLTQISPRELERVNIGSAWKMKKSDS